MAETLTPEQEKELALKTVKEQAEKTVKEKLGDLLKAELSSEEAKEQIILSHYNQS